MKNGFNIRLLLIASSLAGAAASSGCVGETPESGAGSSAAPGGPDPVEVAPEVAPGVDGRATAFTSAEDATTFAVYLEQGGKARKIRSQPVQGHVNELTVEAHAAPSGERVAIVPNYDTFAGTELRVVGADGAERLLVNARVASAAWSEDSAELAYLVMNDHRFEIHLSNGDSAGRTIGTIEALRARILGWSRDKTELYIILDIEHGGPPEVAFGVVNVTTGALRTPFASDAKSSTFYRDFQLVQGEDGEELVSFVLSTTTWPCGGTSRLQLATVNGTLLVDYGATTDSYSQARWSADGEQVTYEVRACADKQKGLLAAQQRMDAVNGVYLAEVSGAAPRRLATGLLRDFRLDSLHDGGVRLTSATRGLQEIQKTGLSLSLDALEAEPVADVPLGKRGPIASAKNMTAQYVHQLWDTPDWFNGNSACGPTSSVMDLAGYQLGAWPITASYPSSHTSNYGQYVAVQYSYGGFTFSATSKDPSGNWAAGAYGHMVKDPNVGSTWAYVASYLDYHVPWAVQQAYGSIGASWVKSQIDANLLVVTSGSVFGYGHIILIRGYTDDGRFYVNDPFGYQVSGSYNGANVIYTWANISPSYFWAA